MIVFNQAWETVVALIVALVVEATGEAEAVIGADAVIGAVDVDAAGLVAGKMKKRNGFPAQSLVG